MTALVGLTYDGSDIQASDHTVFFEIVRGLIDTPSVRGEDTVVPADEGSVEGIRLNDSLSIELRGFVRADPTLTDATAIRTDFWTTMRQVRALFASNRLRAPLVATLPGGTELTIQARPMAIATTIEVGSEFWQGSVLLEGYGDWEESGS